MKTKGAADQWPCLSYTDTTIPLNFQAKLSKVSSLKPTSVVVQPGLCQTWSETLMEGFLGTWLI